MKYFTVLFQCHIYVTTRRVSHEEQELLLFRGIQHMSVSGVRVSQSLGFLGVA